MNKKELKCQHAIDFILLIPPPSSLIPSIGGTDLLALSRKSSSRKSSLWLNERRTKDYALRLFDANLPSE